MTRRTFVYQALIAGLGASAVFALLKQSEGGGRTEQGTQFVTSSGYQLMLNGQPFRFAGANIYWLGLDENVGGIAYPTHFRVDDVLETAQAMGAGVVRSHTLGISTGGPLTFEPALGVFNETALQHIDYAIKAARDHHIRLIIPLTDNWHYYHGGKHNFTDWRGLSDENEFYSNETVINDFKQYIMHLLTHTNALTGIAYKDDPTIIAWETGNELQAPTPWTRNIADFIKSIDKAHLVLDGNYGINVSSLALESVDMVSDHFYPIDLARFASDAGIAKARQKVFLVGEYDWSGAHGGDPLARFLTDSEQSNAIGDLYWSLFAHNDTCGYEQHQDGFTLHYPGDTANMQRRVQMLIAHAHRMSNTTPPPLPAPGIPLITSIRGDRIAWRGTAVAANYSVERSTNNGISWQVICNRCATDNDTPWPDTSKPEGQVAYRLRAYNLADIPGPYSPVYYDPWHGA